jgi:predicted transport protein
VANVKTKLVALEAQKDTLYTIVKLQYAKLQDYKVNLKDAMGCPRNSNEEIGKIGNSALTFLQGTFNGGN